MQLWTENMPNGMFLKSEGFASNLASPESNLTLGDYCGYAQLPYADIGLPIPRNTFASYGIEFQKRFVPGLDTRQVAGLERSSSGFELLLADGKRVTARKVVLAVGLVNFDYVPSILAGLPQELVTHSSRHSRFEQFRGREIAVLGGGASAMDVAAGLLEAGAAVQVVSRRPQIRFHDGPSVSRRSLMERICAPMNGLGPGWRSLACVEAPLLFHRMPEKFRIEVTRRHLGPAAGWTTKEQVAGKLPFHLGCELVQATVEQERIGLEFIQSDGSRKKLLADHVIAATGYRVDVNRLPFLDARLRAEIRSAAGAPVLSSNFESSIAGLYFTGIAAANSFGPLLRFVYGARFAARRLSGHLATSRSARRISRTVGHKVGQDTAA